MAFTRMFRPNTLVPGAPQPLGEIAYSALAAECAEFLVSGRKAFIDENIQERTPLLLDHAPRRPDWGRDWSVEVQGRHELGWLRAECTRMIARGGGVPWGFVAPGTID